MIAFKTVRALRARVTAALDVVHTQSSAPATPANSKAAALPAATPVADRATLATAARHIIDSEARCDLLLKFWVCFAILHAAAGAGLPYAGELRALLILFGLLPASLSWRCIEWAFAAGAAPACGRYLPWGAHWLQHQAKACVTLLSPLARALLRVLLSRLLLRHVPLKRLDDVYGALEATQMRLRAERRRRRLLALRRGMPDLDLGLSASSAGSASVPEHGGASSASSAGGGAADRVTTAGERLKAALAVVGAQAASDAAEAAAAAAAAAADADDSVGLAAVSNVPVDTDVETAALASLPGHLRHFMTAAPCYDDEFEPDSAAAVEWSADYLDEDEVAAAVGLPHHGQTRSGSGGGGGAGAAAASAAGAGAALHDRPVAAPMPRGRGAGAAIAAAASSSAATAAAAASSLVRGVVSTLGGTPRGGGLSSSAAALERDGVTGVPGVATAPHVTRASRVRQSTGTIGLPGLGGVPSAAALSRSAVKARGANRTLLWSPSLADVAADVE